MLIGAAGISIGLLLFGPKLIRMVGEQITKLNPMRAFCVALSAALTVIVAVSYTHLDVYKRQASVLAQKCTCP